MADEWHLIGQRILVTKRTALLAITGVVERVQIAGVPQHDRTETHANASLVHHMKHTGQAVVGLAHKIANCTLFLAEVQHGRGGAAIAHFVDQARQRDIIALPQ